MTRTNDTSATGAWANTQATAAILLRPVPNPNRSRTARAVKVEKAVKGARGEKQFSQQLGRVRVRPLHPQISRQCQRFWCCQAIGGEGRRHQTTVPARIHATRYLSYRIYLHYLRTLVRRQIRMATMTTRRVTRFPISAGAQTSAGCYYSAVGPTDVKIQLRNSLKLAAWSARITTLPTGHNLISWMTRCGMHFSPTHPRWNMWRVWLAHRAAP